MLSDTTKKSEKAPGILKAEVQDTAIVQDMDKTRYTNFNFKPIKVDAPNTFFPTLTSINKTVTRTVKYLKNEPPKMRSVSGAYPMLDYPDRSVKIDTIFFP